MPYIGKTTDGFGVRNRFVYLASSGDTSVSGADANGATLTFTDGAYVDVYLNGVLLKPTTDYNTSTANTIAGLSALNTNDEVTVVVYDIFTVADMVSATSGGTFSGNVNFSGNIDVDGTTNLDVVDIDGALTQDGGAVFNEASADVDFRIESNNKANMFCVDAGNDSVIIGHNAKISAVGFLDANLQLVSGDAQPSLDIVCFSDNANHRGQITFSKSASDTIGTGAVVGTSDIVGDIVWGVHDGTDFGNEIAFIRGQMDSSGVGANDTGGKLQFGTSSDGNNSASERMRIQEDGSIGIGKYPATFTTGTGVHLGDNRAIGFGDGDNGRPDFQIACVSGLSLDFRCGNGADTADLTINPSGVFSGDFNDTSDERLKENIQDIADNQIAVLKQLRPVTFDWKEKNKGSDTGFIAQEVKKLLPNDVHYQNPEIYESESDLPVYTEQNKEDGIIPNGKKVGDKVDDTIKVGDMINPDSMMAINLQGVVAVLTKALQEAVARIEALESK
jgi:hypothetical protein